MNFETTVEPTSTHANIGSNRSPVVPRPIEKKGVSCPVCSSEKNEVLYKPWLDIQDPIKLYGAASGIQGTQTIVSCTGCGMIFENPQFPEDVILSGYKSSQEGGHDSQYPMRVKSFFHALKRLEGSLPPKGAHVLDVGSAGGAFLDAAKEFGYEAVGLEPSEFLVKQAQARGLKVSQGTIEENKLPQGHFDMVCFWDVIEHVVDPKQSLIEIKKVLKPGGTLLINYPDIGTLQAKAAGKKFWWILSNHLHYFARPTIKRLMEDAGYEVFHFRRHWQTLEFGYLQQMAMHYKIPGSAFFKKISPQWLQRIPMSYYASQTCVLGRLKK